jgi:excisionase family DNA binding protein
MSVTIDLKDLVTQAVNEALEPHLRQLNQMAKPYLKPVYTPEEVAEMFGVSKRHLQYLRDSQQIGFVQNGRKILFRAEDLTTFFDQHYVARRAS